jgi:hypothetical protein
MSGEAGGPTKYHFRRIHSSEGVNPQDLVGRSGLRVQSIRDQNSEEFNRCRGSRWFQRLYRLRGSQYSEGECNNQSELISERVS